MNANANNNARGGNPNRGGPATRGGRGGGQRGGQSRAPKLKIGPTRALEGFEWSGEKALKDAFLVSVAGANGAQSWTFHRPIGRSGIVRPERAWVATYTAEVEFLLEREKPPAWKTWSSRRAKAISDDLLSRAGNGRVNRGDPVVVHWDFAGSPPCGEEIARLQQTAVAAGENQSKWLDYASDEIKAQEAVWKTRNKSAAPPAAWVSANPEPITQTLGGPLGNQAQVAVAYLEGKDASAAKDLVMRKLLGVVTTPAV